MAASLRIDSLNSLDANFRREADRKRTSRLAARQAGDAEFTVLGAVAELERSIITERVKAGQRAAKRRGVRFGRPSTEVDIDRIGKLRRAGLSWRAIAAQTGLAKDTLRRAVEA